MVTQTSQQVTWGTTFFKASRISAPLLEQQVQRIGTGLPVDRLGREGPIPYVLSDFSAGLEVSPGIYSVERGAGKYRVNLGVQTRLRGLCCLAYEPTNQSAVTSDEDISSAVASNWRRHDLLTAVGSSTGNRYYSALGHKLYRVNSGAWEVADTFTDVVTAMAELEVGGSKVLAVATNGATDDVKYTTDPTAGTISWVTLVALSSGDYITGMDFFQTLGPGTNVVVGKITTNGMWYMEGAEAAAWSMKTLVLEDTKNEEDPSTPLTTTGPQSPTWASADNEDSATGGPRVNSSATAERMLWASPLFVLASDNSRAACTFATDQAVNDLSGYLYAGGFDFSSVPPVALVKGLNYAMEGRDSSASGNDPCRDFDVSLLVNGSRKGINRAEDTGAPFLSSTDSTREWGDTDDDGDDDWGAEWTGADLQHVVMRFQFRISVVPTVQKNAEIDHMVLSATWRLPGTQPSLPLGGYDIARNASRPLRMTVVTPRADDTAGTTVPREMWHLDFQWDAAGGRPTVTLSQPNEGMDYVWCATSVLGGYLMGGGSGAVPGDQLRFINSSGRLLNYLLPQEHNGQRVAVNAVYGVGSWAILEMLHYSSGTTVADRQWWYLDLGESPSYFPDFVIQSLSGLSISAAPPPSGVALVDSADNLIFSAFPNSTDTAVQRVFCPPDPSADPRVANTDQAFTDATVYLETVRLAIGPEDANKSLGTIQFIGDEISANGSGYGTVKVEVSTDGGSTFPVSNTFNAYLGEYEEPSAGRAYNDLLIKITPSHGAGTTETPNALRILFSTSQQWPWLQTYVFWVDDPEDFEPNLYQFLTGVQTLIDTKVTQPLSFADRQDIPAKLLRVLWPQGGIRLSPWEQPPTKEDFIARDGSALAIGLVFEEVPGKGTA